MRNNKLKDVSFLTDKELLSLNHLILAGNQISRFPRVKAPEINYFSVENNLFEDLDDNLEDMPKLSIINIFGNKLKKLTKLPGPGGYNINFSDNLLESV